MGDTKVPMQISAVCLGLNLIIVVPMIFTFPKGQQAGALGVANVASSLVNVALLSYALKRKMPKWRFGPLIKPLVGMLLTAGVAGVLAWYLHWNGWRGWGLKRFGIRIGRCSPRPSRGVGLLGDHLGDGIREARDFVALVRNRRSQD